MNRKVVYIGLGFLIVGLLLALISTTFSVTGREGVQRISLSLDQTLLSSNCKDARVMYYIMYPDDVVVRTSKPFSIVNQVSLKTDFTVVYEGNPDSIIARYYCADTNSFISVGGSFNLGDENGV